MLESTVEHAIPALEAICIQMFWLYTTHNDYLNILAFFAISNM